MNKQDNLNQSTNNEQKQAEVKRLKKFLFLFIALTVISFTLIPILAPVSQSLIFLPVVLFLVLLLVDFILIKIIRNKNFDPDSNTFIVMGYPCGEHKHKMLCELFEDRFELTTKREALIDFSADKHFVIPYDKIDKITQLDYMGVLGVELFLNDDTIDRPLFGKATSTVFGGMGGIGGLIGGAIHGKGKFKFYFKKSANYEKFVKTIPIVDKPNITAIEKTISQENNN